MEANPNSLQKKLFGLIQDLIPDKMSMVYELSDVIGISQDSVYRRLRGETLLGINEIQLLCSHYGISFDNLCRLEQTGLVSFRFEPVRNMQDFISYLTSIRNTLKWLTTKKTHIYYAAIDLPVFHNFRFPIVSYFKSFYWLKSISGIPELRDVRFSCDGILPEVADLGREISELYTHIPSTEIWTDLILNSILKQIDYYWESCEFKSKEDALALVDQVSQEFEFMNTAAENSSKMPGKNNNSPDNFTAYFCDIEIANNCILVEYDNQSSVYLSTHTYNSLMTTNELFCKETGQWINGIKSKSLLISGTGEKQRIIFFRNARSKISTIRQKITEQKSGINP